MASYQHVETMANRKTTTAMKGFDDVAADDKTPRASVKVRTHISPSGFTTNTTKRANIPKPLQTNTFGNLQPARVISKVSPDDTRTIPIQTQLIPSTGTFTYSRS